MKKLVCLLAASTLFASCTPTPTPLPGTSPIKGLWKGDYACGDANLTLDVQEVTGDQVKGVFNFGYYANKDTKTIDPSRKGSFNLSGTYRNNELNLRAGTWLEKPSESWNVLDVLVTYDELNKKLVGRLPKPEGGVVTDECLKVTLTR